jgi:hypothetical protein
MNYWKEEELQFIGEACLTFTNKELGEAIGRSASAVSYQLLKMGVGRNLKHWKETELKWIRKNAFIGIAKLAVHFKVSTATIIGCLKNHGIVTGNNTKFKKGIVPFNKGKKVETWMRPELIEKMKRTSFKKGDLPHNTLHDGAISIRTDKTGKKYKYIRLKQAKWELYHRFLWMEAYGKIPQGSLIVFKDGNEMNCVLENLELITMKVNMERNTIHRYPEEVKGAIRIVSKLKRKINHYEEQH